MVTLQSSKLKDESSNLSTPAIKKNKDKRIRKKMKVKIKDKRFINPTSVLEKLITGSYKSDLLKGLSNLSKITEDDIFEVTAYFTNYAIIENKKGSFIVRDDNLTEYDCIENNLTNLGIKKIIN